MLILVLFRQISSALLRTDQSTASNNIFFLHCCDLNSNLARQRHSLFGSNKVTTQRKAFKRTLGSLFQNELPVLFITFILGLPHFEVFKYQSIPKIFLDLLRDIGCITCSTITAILFLVFVLLIIEGSFKLYITNAREISPVFGMIPALPLFQAGWFLAQESTQFFFLFWLNLIYTDIFIADMSCCPNQIMTLRPRTVCNPSRRTLQFEALIASFTQRSGLNEIKIRLWVFLTGLW